MTPTDPTPYTPTDDPVVLTDEQMEEEYLTTWTPGTQDEGRDRWRAWLTARDARVRADQQEIDLAMHSAYRPEVVAEVAVCLDDDADWERIATWCGGRTTTTQDPSGEYTSALVLPDGQYGWPGAWIVKRLDGTFAVRAEVEAPDSGTLPRVRAEAIAPVLALHGPSEYGCQQECREADGSRAYPCPSVRAVSIEQETQP